MREAKYVENERMEIFERALAPSVQSVRTVAKVPRAKPSTCNTSNISRVVTEPLTSQHHEVLMASVTNL